MLFVFMPCLCLLTRISLITVHMFMIWPCYCFFVVVAFLLFVFPNYMFTSLLLFFLNIFYERAMSSPEK